MTVEEAKKFLRKNFDLGVNCPCCGQLVKNWRRKLDSRMARALIGLHQLTSKNKHFFHIVEIERAGHKLAS
ncbi:MAG TPA: hypothetical protein VNX68_15720, partial [Nitrosopumilaceae archaeon]|nr:hypothetical protein [Nitrosopumilaceae archaeon]